MSRPHPFDVAFGPVAEAWFNDVRAAAPGTETGDFAVFSGLAPVQRILSELQPEGSAAVGVTEQAEEYLRLLYTCYHYWIAGRQDRELSLDAITRPPQGGAAPAREAMYCRLPEHRVWAQVSDAAPHEPVDGFFLAGGARAGRESAPEWTLVAVLGLRADRDGFSQVSVTASHEDLLAARSPRDPPFAPTMSGGALAGFHSISSVAELLLLGRLALVSVGR